MMNFKIDLTTKPFKGKLIHDGMEFDFEDFRQLDGAPGTAPLIVGRTLSLEFNIATGRIMHLWGYSPRESWKTGTVSPPSFSSGAVFVEFERLKPERGEGIIVENLEVNEIFDAETNWLLLGSAEAEERVEIATNIVLGITKSKLVGVWLHPSFRR